MAKNKVSLQHNENVHTNNICPIKALSPFLSSCGPTSGWVTKVNYHIIIIMLKRLIVLVD